MTTSYFPAVTYCYEVGGKSFLGDRIRPGFDLGSGLPAIAESMLASYPANSVVTVHYDPENPALAVLETASAGATPERIFHWVGGCSIAGAIAVLGLGAIVAHFVASLDGY